MQKLRLKAIKFGCDFRFSEASNYEELVRKKHFPGPPGKGEVYLLVSSVQIRESVVVDFPRR